MSQKSRPTRLPPPYLKRVWLPGEADGDGLDWDNYPLSLPLLHRGAFDLAFDKSVTIIVGENGSGKSTLLEAIATLAGFSEGGGASGMRAVGPSAASGEDGARLGQLLKAAWLPQVRRGWFFRAETFFSVARYLDEAGSTRAGFLRASHGEGFLSFFEERLTEQGLYILDEPEICAVTRQAVRIPQAAAAIAARGKLPDHHGDALAHPDGAARCRPVADRTLRPEANRARRHRAFQDLPRVHPLSARYGGSDDRLNTADLTSACTAAGPWRRTGSGPAGP